MAKSENNSASSDSLYPTGDEWENMEDRQKIVTLHDWLLEMYLNLKLGNHNLFNNKDDNSKKVGYYKINTK